MHWDIAQHILENSTGIHKSRMSTSPAEIRANGILELKNRTVKHQLTEAVKVFT